MEIKKIVYIVFLPAYKNIIIICIINILYKSDWVTGVKK